MERAKRKYVGYFNWSRETHTLYASAFSLAQAKSFMAKQLGILHRYTQHYIRFKINTGDIAYEIKEIKQPEISKGGV